MNPYLERTCVLINQKNSMSQSSVVTVQVGQCGNSLGETVLNALFQECAAGRKRRRDQFFHECRAADLQEEVDLVERLRNPDEANTVERKRPLPKRTAKAVLVDMEPRVIDNCLESSRTRGWQYSESRCFRFEGGSGNNWAKGFVKFGPDVSEAVLELVRKEVEACDWLSGFVMLHSIAGGTGSGLGTFLNQQLSDNFPNAVKANCAVWPHQMGEVAVQSYNAMLTLAELQESSSAIIHLFNDEAKTVCQRVLKVDRPSLSDLNCYFSRNLCCGLLMPSRSAFKLVDPLQDTLRGMRVTHSLNSLRVFSVPQMPNTSLAFSAHSWDGLVKEAKQSFHRKFSERSLAQIWTVRGKNGREAARWFAPEAGQQENLLYGEKKGASFGLDKSISALVNSAEICSHLTTSLKKAKVMFSANAYVHQFINAGLPKDEIAESMLRIQQLIQDYRAATHAPHLAP